MGKILILLLLCSCVKAQDKPIKQPYFDTYTNQLVFLTKKVVYFNQKRLSAKSPVEQARMQDSIVKYQTKIRRL